MALGKRLINTGSAAAAACSTDSVQAFGANNAFSSNIALYQLDGNDDDTTTNYDGTSDTGVTYSATGAKFGQAASFNGSSSKIELPSALSDGSTTLATCISFWFNVGAEVTSSTTGNEIMQFAGTSTHTGKIALGSTSGHMSGETFSVTHNVAGIYTYSQTNIPAGWNHAVVQWNSSDGKWDIYINSVKHTTYTVGTNAQGYFKLKFGNRSTVYYTGSLDQVRIFDKAISQEEVATLYAETSSTASNTNPFSEGSGVALYTMDYDASEASGYYDGTPTNVDFGVGGQINYGARFNGSSSYITADKSMFGTGDGVANLWSISLWFKTNGSVTASRTLIGTKGSGVQAGFFLYMISGGQIRYYEGNTSTNSQQLTTTATYDDSNWHNIVITRSGTTDVFTMYIDGTEIIAPTTMTNPHTSHNFNLHIGRYPASSIFFWDGDIDQVRIFSKALNQTEVDTLYAETACVYDSTTDDNYFPLADGSSDAVAYYKLDNSAEDSVGTNDGTDTNVEYRFGRFGQAAAFNGSNNIDIDNVIPTDLNASSSMWVKSSEMNLNNTTVKTIFYNRNPYFVIYRYAGNWLFVIKNSSSTNYTVSYPVSNFNNNQWYHFAATCDGLSGTMNFYVNGISVGTTSSPSSILNVAASAFIGSGANAQYFNGSIDQIRVYSTALTDSQVTELYNEKPEVDTSNFKTVLYEGTGSTQYISNVGIDLDVDNGGDGGLVWLKNRTTANSHALFDTIRGANFRLQSNSAAKNTSVTTNLTSFDANGFFLGNAAGINANNNNYVTWVWKGGGEAVENYDGTIQGANCMVSANTEAGFSIVKWTGNNLASQTIGHGLSSTPEITIIKKLTGTTLDWQINLNSSITGTEGYFNFNTAALYTTFPNYYTSANSTVISTNGTTTTERQYNNQSADYIAYCFHSVEGYSKIGTYSGNNNTNGPEITTGFKPSWIMIKRLDVSGHSWLIYDSVRSGSDFADDLLYANLSNSENPLSNRFEFKDTSFKILTNNASHNGSGIDNFLYMAFK